MEIEVRLRTVEDIKNFVNEVANIPCNVTCTGGNYIVDAKSIMGIFSLDTSQVLKVALVTDNATEDELKALEEIKNKYKVEE